MGNFKSPCGKYTFCNDNEEIISPIWIGRRYANRKRKELDKPMMYMCKKCRRGSKVDTYRTVGSLDNAELYSVKDTVCICKNQTPVPETVKHYAEQCSNTLVTQKVEIILQTEEWRRTEIREWVGNVNMYEFMQGFADDLWEELMEKYGDKEDERNSYIMLPMVNLENGDRISVEIDGQHDLESMIVSVRCIEWSEIITDKEKI